MDEDRVRQIAKQELAELIGADKFILDRHIQILNGRNIQTSRGSGTRIATAPTIPAGLFVVDDVYNIKTVGTTDFTAIGAASNTVGLKFTATGAGSGTGDAYEMGQKIAFYGAASPVAQPATVTDPSITTVGAVNGSGATTAQETAMNNSLNSLDSKVSDIIDRLQELGLIA